MADSNNIIEVEIWQHTIRLQPNPALFSPDRADRGTMAMLSLVDLQAQDVLLDLGCGSGIVGIAAAKVLGAGQVTLVDIDARAVETARVNALLNDLADLEVLCGDGLAATEKQFSQILCNPPYHTDFSVAKRFIEQGYEHLLPGGKLWLVVKRLQWYKMKMKHVFSGVRVFEVDGYYVLMSERRNVPVSADHRIDRPKKTTRKHLRRQQAALKKSSSAHKKRPPDGENGQK